MKREGNMPVLKVVLPMIAAFAIAACTHQPRTDEELAGEAQHAVDDHFDVQGKFSLMEAVASRNIACGHVAATEVPGHGDVDQDFVYRDGRLIMDDDPDYDSAAIACDLATGGGNSTAADN